MDLPGYIDREAWDGFVEMRRAKGKRAPFTERAERMVLNKLVELKTAGHCPNASLDQSVRNGWSDVYQPKDMGKEVATFKERDAENARLRVHEMTGGLVSAKPVSITRRNDALQEIFDARDTALRLG